MPTLENSITIAAPIEQVFHVACDIEHIPEWFVGSSEFSNVNQTANMRDSTWDWNYRILGWRFKGQARLVECNEPHRSATAMIGAGLNFAVNSSLVALAIAFETRSQPILVWNERFRWLLPHYVILGVLAAAMAVAYDDWGLAGIGLVLVPIAMVWLGMKQYVGMVSALSHRHQGA